VRDWSAARCLSCSATAGGSTTWTRTPCAML
jgi:hypothetical protein